MQAQRHRVRDGLGDSQDTDRHGVPNIGRGMDVRYRETAGGGLAATPTGRRLARERLVQIKRG